MDRRTFVFKASLGTFVGLAGLPLDAALEAPLGTQTQDSAGAFSAPSSLGSLKIDVQAPDLPPTPLSMPGLFPGRVVEAVHSQAIVNHRVSQPAVREMLAQGITALTGEKRAADAWAKFVAPTDIVGIKVNPSGTPTTTTQIALVREVIRSLTAAGVPPKQIIVWDRNSNQLEVNGYHLLVPPGVRVIGLDQEWVVNGETHGGYDRNVFCEMDCFGERETRSYLGRIVSTEVTKIINLPVMKEHNAGGVTGCLKNLAYGSYNNVARTHVPPKTFTSPVIAVMCHSAPVRTKAVLHIMDGLRAVYHSGPFAWNPDFHWEAKTLLIGTDPVAVDRIELETVEKKRRELGVPSLWDRNPQNLGSANEMGATAHKNRFYREPGHIKVASALGLGRFELNEIDHRRLTVG
jgi:uncharacterized protein (DUF362 family)